MDYFIFGHSSEVSEIGCTPQCQPSPNINPKSYDSSIKVRHDSFPDFIPRVELVLEKRAKLTAILASVNIRHGYIVNSVTRKTLKTMKLPPHAFYPVKVFAKSETLEYFWFHMINADFWEWVDRKNSEMVLRSRLPDKHQEILAKADLSLPEKELSKLTKGLHWSTKYYWEKLVFNENFQELDIFLSPFPIRETIISKRLLSAFKEAGVTGYEVKPFEAIEGDNIPG